MISVFDVFKVGIGPSSSHTVGPMVAAKQFLHDVSQLKGMADSQTGSKVDRVKVTLFGSLAATGVGHGTDTAILLGLMGHEPRTIDPAKVQSECQKVKSTQVMRLAFFDEIAFVFERDLLFENSVLEQGHPNAMHFIAYDRDGMVLHSQTYYSIGGGFIQKKGEDISLERPQPPFVFNSANALLALCEKNQCQINEIVLQNELFWHTESELDAEIQFIWDAMQACIERGLNTAGELPGGLHLARRASRLKDRLQPDTAIPAAAEVLTSIDFFTTMDWVNAWALAVNEENAAGGRVVTAPTNGAAGIIPAVLKFAQKVIPDFSPKHVREFLLTATAFGYLFKKNASISGAEVGCQGEVGSACAMAAAGLAALLGASSSQIENAAEIATEHNLGLTCDPVAGLVQVPCIERNAIAAMKAINAARLAILGDGHHFISFDKVVRTVRETGADMQSKYKETSLGGLAVNFIEC